MEFNSVKPSGNMDAEAARGEKASSSATREKLVEEIIQHREENAEWYQRMDTMIQRAEEQGLFDNPKSSYSLPSSSEICKETRKDLNRREKMEIFQGYFPVT